MVSTLKGILETALYADDLDAAEAFYEGVLGLTKIARAAGRHVFFRCGEGMLLIFNPTETTKPMPPDALAVPLHGAQGPGHMCFRVDAAELQEWNDRLKAAGLAIEADIVWPNGARSFYVRDPAGNSIEFAEPGLWPIGKG